MKETELKKYTALNSKWIIFVEMFASVVHKIKNHKNQDLLKLYTTIHAI